MIVKKIWTLFKPNADRADVAFLSGLGCECEVIIPEPLQFEYMGQKYKYNGVEWPTIKITTTCEKQEMMLKLKYGDDLQIKQIIHTKLTPYEDKHLVPRFGQTT
jgi:hypothetical protein